MVRLSIIIPVYKVEKYIEECLESICSQLVGGVEVIIVNDGTPDDSMLIAKNYIFNNYNNLKNQFIFIDQENQGQSEARNNGLSIAKGYYVSFVDSDDKIVDKYLEELLPLLDGEVDIIQFQACRFLNENNNEKIKFNVGVELDGEFFLTKELIKKIFNKSAWFPWLNIYKINLFKDKRFEKGIYFEDAVIVPDLFLNSKKIIFLSEVLYCYRFNCDSSLLDFSERNITKLSFSYNQALNINFEKTKYNNIYSPVIISFLRNYMEFVCEKDGFLNSYIVYKKFKNKIFPYIEKSNLERGNLIFYKYGFLFFLIQKILNKISKNK